MGSNTQVQITNQTPYPLGEMVIKNYKYLVQIVHAEKSMILINSVVGVKDLGDSNFIISSKRSKIY